MHLEISDEILELSINKTIYWRRMKTLILSDPHFGKVSHFRKHGIPVPNRLMEINYRRLEESIDRYSPHRVIFLGDLFHSDQNEEWEFLKSFILSYHEIHFVLIIGNHDILEKQEFENCKLNMMAQLTESPFIFTHYPLTKEVKEYNLCGHLHPAVRLSGGPGQSARFPCFHFTASQGILPAFSEFTGNYKVKPKKNDKVVVVAEKKLILFQQKSMKSIHSN